MEMGGFGGWWAEHWAQQTNSRAGWQVSRGGSWGTRKQWLIQGDTREKSREMALTMSITKNGESSINAHLIYAHPSSFLCELSTFHLVSLSERIWPFSDQVCLWVHLQVTAGMPSMLHPLGRAGSWVIRAPGPFHFPSLVYKITCFLSTSAPFMAPVAVAPGHECNICSSF